MGPTTSKCPFRVTVYYDLEFAVITYPKDRDGYCAGIWLIDEFLAEMEGDVETLLLCMGMDTERPLSTYEVTGDVFLQGDCWGFENIREKEVC